MGKLLIQQILFVSQLQEPDQPLLMKETGRWKGVVFAGFLWELERT
jgi:hypothetical protein